MQRETEIKIAKSVGSLLNKIAIISPSIAATLSLKLFSIPKKGRLKAHQVDFLNQFEHHILKVGKHSIMTYHKKGKGPSILLCHGWESSSFRWRKLIKHLSKTDLNIIMIDAPAHGNSSGKTFTVLLYADVIKNAIIKYKPKYLCGHSVGGMAAVYALKVNGNLSVQKAIILASPDKLKDISKQYFKTISGSDKLKQAFEKKIEKLINKPISLFSTSIFAKDIRLPCLIIHDKSDQINKYEESLQIHNNWKHSVLFTTQSCGHALQSDEVFQRIQEYICE